MALALLTGPSTHGGLRPAAARGGSGLRQWAAAPPPRHSCARRTRLATATTTPTAAMAGRQGRNAGPGRPARPPQPPPGFRLGPGGLLPTLLGPAAVALAVLFAMGGAAVLLPLVLLPLAAPLIIVPAGLALGAAVAASALAIPAILALGVAAAGVGLLGSGAALALQLAALGGMAVLGAGAARALTGRVVVGGTAADSGVVSADGTIDIDARVLGSSDSGADDDADGREARAAEAAALADFDAKLARRERERQLRRGERWDQ